MNDFFAGKTLFQCKQQHNYYLVYLTSNSVSKKGEKKEKSFSLALLNIQPIKGILFV